MVVPGVYRSSYPKAKHFAFLASLKLRSILYLCPEEYPEENKKFMEAHGIKLLRHPMDGNKEPFRTIPEERVVEALHTILDPANRPLLIHCNKGKHRTGCVVGCLRKLQQWSLTAIFAEYGRHAGAKVRVIDQHFMEFFDETQIDSSRMTTLPTFAGNAIQNEEGSPTETPNDKDEENLLFPQGSTPQALTDQDLWDHSWYAPSDMATLRSKADSYRSSSLSSSSLPCIRTTAQM